MIWYDVMKRLADSGLNPVEETYMENTAKSSRHNTPSFEIGYSDAPMAS
jgi:hypothetical protein